jgi:antitoxin (DNA-binding transcriptional repressor) of toxin-antitoxin stability system
MRVSARYAEQHFEELLDAMDRGDDVEIDRGEKPSARLTLVPRMAGGEEKVSLLGGMKGEIWLAPDWDSPETNRMMEDMFYGERSASEVAPKA